MIWTTNSQYLREDPDSPRIKEVSLDSLIKKVDPRNPALREGQEILMRIKRDPYSHASAYAAGIYFIVGGDPNLGLDSLAYGMAENKRGYGFGLMREEGVGPESYKVYRLLEKFKPELTGVVKSVAKQYEVEISNQPRLFTYVEALEADGKLEDENAKGVRESSKYSNKRCMHQLFSMTFIESLLKGFSAETDKLIEKFRTAKFKDYYLDSLSFILKETKELTQNARTLADFFVERFDITKNAFKLIEYGTRMNLSTKKD